VKALGKLKKEAGIWLYDAPMPQMGPDDVLIKIQKTSICGTDVHIYNWDEWAQKTIPVPMTTGHEFYGIVEKVGSNVKTVKPGDRVSGESHLICWDCYNCKTGKHHLCPNTLGIGVTCPGCFAEYFAFPASNVIVLPGNVSDDVASMLDPLGNAVHTALSFNLAGEDVLITGAGPIGIMAAAIARHVGAHRVVITDVNPYRLELAQKMGATKAVDVSKEELSDVMKKLGMTKGFDVGLEMSGNPAALNSMIEVMNNGGKIVLLGILPHNAVVNWTKIIFKGLFLKGIYGREMFETWYKMIALLESGLNVDPVVTHVFKVDDFEKAFEVMRSAQSGKVVLDWT
jgi:threonine 3-dehydrogenase